ncbi:bifunctional DNA-formamidopyrimidine glycosylase/DNA-(apurinic or apyrimidinic site) lyase [Frankia sp. AgPm24]|uniref:bifunctional DNA-formamidopyrimidine glycosylase/DNA-(apurinic or apyrimidinic site) lyase n=1 Tax=Frankia sp. AgPm24 TaxID=631128 RepID=UPI0020107C09|nr:bifunctional DNA-formamidopyrimidine glycosylase/DNA-(apurinic or apyrimidinic site) lyase [Frankia sp. AgPm24]MCK9922790.1 bifunctional DNA-formamidopyrimidine glycosylase/DNA-(apurinic or apyrimidinic site) lyase [Frankia sp. AgPm24]
MPELPEVEVVRRGLERGVVGRVIADVDVHHPRAIRRHTLGAEDFRAALIGQRIMAARRRGKFLWLALRAPTPAADAPADGDALLAHLGMSGQLLVVPSNSPDQTHLRVRFTFADGGRELRFVDQRTFGGLAVAVGGAELPAPVTHIALDPLDPVFDLDQAIRRLRARRTGLKRALLDQTLVSGIGNIYADEALWAARLHYARPTETMTREQAHRVLTAATTVMSAALDAGGTSFDRLYVSVEGVSGLFERSLQVYGRAGDSCARCGGTIRRDAFMNRSSFTCPICQPPPRHPRW